MKIKIVLEIILALAAIIATAWLVAPYVMPTSEPTPEPVDEFDPRLAPASTVYEMPDGTHIRGLKMTDEAFRFMTNDVEDPFIKQDMRKQVDDAEKAYTRHK
jgi:hypothetical protein